MRRRSCLQFLLSFPLTAVTGWTAREGVLDFDVAPVVPREGPQDLCQMRYRADATVLVLGLPIFSRGGVGGGEAQLRRWQQDSEQVTAIEFLAGSDPKRAGGLNRLGAFEERILENKGALRRAAYFGFMTASPEEDESAGRDALKKPTGKTANFQAISGDIEPRQALSWRCDVELGSELTWRTGKVLRQQVREALRSQPLKETQQALERATGTFLYSVLNAAWSDQREIDTSYIYSGRSYRLKTKRKADASQGRKLAEKSIVVDPLKVERLEGEITRLDNGSKSDFKVWMDRGSGDLLPVRFEYKPRGFLRVAFEKQV